MFTIAKSTYKLIALLLAFQLVVVTLFANFHLGQTEHELGEKPHIHLSFNDHEHHGHMEHEAPSSTDNAQNIYAGHDHNNEIHIHLNLIEAKPSVHALAGSPSSEVIPILNTSIRSLGKKPLLPPPTA